MGLPVCERDRHSLTGAPSPLLRPGPRASTRELCLTKLCRHIPPQTLPTFLIIPPHHRFRWANPPKLFPWPRLTVFSASGGHYRNIPTPTTTLRLAAVAAAVDPPARNSIALCRPPSHLRAPICSPVSNTGRFAVSLQLHHPSRRPRRPLSNDAPNDLLHRQTGQDLVTASTLHRPTSFDYELDCANHSSRDANQLDLCQPRHWFMRRLPVG